MTTYRAQVEQLLAPITRDPGDIRTWSLLTEAARALATLTLAGEVQRIADAIAPAPSTGDDLRARLIALLPTEPMLRRGLPNELADAMGRYGAFEEVAEVLGVTLPLPPNPDQ